MIFFTKINENSNTEHFSDIHGASFSQICVPIFRKKFNMKGEITEVKKLTFNIIAFLDKFKLFEFSQNIVSILNNFQVITYLSLIIKAPEVR